MRLVLIFLLSSLLLACMVVLAVWWSERRYQDGYHEGYQDACQWIEDHTGDILTPSYILEEP